MNDWLRILGATVMVFQTTGAIAQINTGEIAGIVRDSSGGVLVGASVTATHVASGLMVARVTDGTGRFYLPGLRIGAWRVEARLAGLAPQNLDATLEVGRMVTLEFALAVQGLAEQVDVQRGARPGGSPKCRARQPARIGALGAGWNPPHAGASAKNSAHRRERRNQ